MTAAYVLAEELDAANGDYRWAFRRYKNCYVPMSSANKMPPSDLRVPSPPRRDWVLSFAISS